MLAFAVAALVPVALAVSPRGERLSPASTELVGVPPADDLPLAGRSAAATFSAVQPIAPALLVVWLVVAGFLVGREFTGHVDLNRSGGEKQPGGLCPGAWLRS